MSNSTSYSGGIGFFGMLTVLFIGLKLCNVIDWSWWWVLVPLWAPITILLIVCIILLIIGGIIACLN